MQLVIAEKPSVARSIAEVIGATKVSDGYMEGNGYVVSWCVGHLVELAQPESYGEQWKKWTYESLPVKPEKWQPRCGSGISMTIWLLPSGNMCRMKAIPATPGREAASF